MNHVFRVKLVLGNLGGPQYGEELVVAASLAKAIELAEKVITKAMGEPVCACAAEDLGGVLK